MINIIYGLKDPRNDVFQYIGKSTIGNKRALSHLSKSHSKEINNWINELAKEWLYPIVELIEENIELDNLSARELYWTEYYYNINPKLLNKKLIPAPLQNIRTAEDEDKFDELVRIVSDISNILKYERLWRNISQEEFSKKMGVSRSTLSLCENGNNVTFKTIQKYVLTLKGVDIVKKDHKQRIFK